LILLKFFETIKDKFDMYDETLAGLLAKNTVIRHKGSLESSNIAIGYNTIQSDAQISKFFIIRKYPAYIHPKLTERIRDTCLRGGNSPVSGEARINFYIYSEPHQIPWDSPAMKQKLRVWDRALSNKEQDANVFHIRENYAQSVVEEQLKASNLYFNTAELTHHRTTCKVMIMIEFAVPNSSAGTELLSEILRKFRNYCASNEITAREIRVSLFDWLQSLSVFSLKNIPEIRRQQPYRTVTDDVLSAGFNSYKQGRVGERGIPMGIDVHSKTVVLKHFKSDPDKAENMLIAAQTGSGKSFYVKTLTPYFLAENFVVTVMDYEGDEYMKIARLLRGRGKLYADDVVVVSLGKKNAPYFDPMRIGDLTGEPEIDDDLKDMAVRYTMAMFKVLITGAGGELPPVMDSVISRAIKEAYLDAGVTSDPETWGNSKNLRIHSVYGIIAEYVENKTLADPETGNVEHNAAADIVRACRPYFEKGEAKAGTFSKSMDINALFKAKFVIFEFGMKGENNTQSDQKLLALKQLSVANISIQISNHCKYALGKFNVKVWEEYQRYGRIAGSEEIIINALTGGRKRGDVNFLITTDLNAILDSGDRVCAALLQSFNSMAIGTIASKDIREKFCAARECKEIADELERIAKANEPEDERENGKKQTHSYRDIYKNAFCLVLDSGKKAVVQAQVPQAVLDSRIFSAGVEKKLDQTKVSGDDFS
jgi:hypothetical protein